MRRLLLILSAIFLVFAPSMTASATQGEDHKVWVCHATSGWGELKNGYNLIFVDVASTQPGYEGPGNGNHYHHSVVQPHYQDNNFFGPLNDIIFSEYHDKDQPPAAALCDPPTPPTTTTTTTTPPTTTTVVVTTVPESPTTTSLPHPTTTTVVVTTVPEEPTTTSVVAVTTPPTIPPTPTIPPNPILPETGSETWTMALIAGMLVTLGVGSLALARRKR